MARQVLIPVYILYPPSTLPGATFCGWLEVCTNHWWIFKLLSIGVRSFSDHPCSFISPPSAPTPNLLWAGWVGNKLILKWWLLVAKMANSPPPPNSLHSHMSVEMLSFRQVLIPVYILYPPSTLPGATFCGWLEVCTNHWWIFKLLSIGVRSFSDHPCSFISPPSAPTPNLL